MNTIGRAVSALALCACLGACATVTRGTTTKFKVESTPSGASMKTTTGFACTTPCTLKLPRKEAFDATVSKSGFRTQTVHVLSKVRGGGTAGLVGNVVAGGILGMAIDGTNGSMDDLVPNPLKVTLQADGAPEPAAAAPAAGGQ